MNQSVIPLSINRLPRIIGFMGNIGAGKDSACDYLHQQYNYRKRGFSDPVYEQLWNLNPLVRINDNPDYMPLQILVRLDGWDKAKREHPEIRQWLRVGGTENGRDIHGQDCWLHVMELRSREDVLTAIRDVRFPNEGQWIRSAGGILVAVESERSIPADPTQRSEQLDYRAEADYIITNNGDKLELGRQIETVLDRFDQCYKVPFPAGINDV